MKRWFIILCLCLLTLPTMAQSDDDDAAYPPQYATDETIAVVVYPRVNMRTAPNTGSLVVDIAILGERFPIVGMDDTEQWFLVEANGGVVWIHYGSVITANAEELENIGENLTPQQQASVDAQVAFAQATLGVRGALNIRRGPSTSYAIVGRVPADGRVFVQGRDLYGLWILVNYNGAVGWVSSSYLLWPAGYLLDSIPVVR